MDITRILPEECLCLIISLTSPVDACGSAMVSHALRSVADCDAVWEKFLPSDYKSIISGSSSSSLLSLGKKDLYFYLCFYPILFQNGSMSFQLEKESGKKCYMLGARALTIIWGDTPSYWTWTSLQQSRFGEVAKLRIVWWLEVKGKIDSKILSPNTNYAAYLVFMLNKRYARGFSRRNVTLQFIVNEVVSKVWNVSLEQEDNPQHVLARGDGWMEVEIGEFFNECGDDGTVEFSLMEVNGYTKQGLLLEGIELRPKNLAN